MALISDLLLIAAALGAAFYCFVLSRRLSALNAAEGGIGQAIATLSDQIARLEQVLDGSRQRVEELEKSLNAAIVRAEQLEQSMAAPPSEPPLAPARTTPKATALRVETQPASFRRRLFSEAIEEKGA